MEARKMHEEKGTEYGVVILAAGASTRMGRSKSSLPYAPQKTFLSRLVEVYCELGCTQIVVVSNPDNMLDILVSIEAQNIPKVKVIVNKRQELGRTYSLQLGINQLLKETEFCFVQDVDRPSISLGTLELLKSMGQAGSWSYLKYNGQKGHPVLISEEIMKHIGECDPKSTVLSDVLSDFPSIGSDTSDSAVVVNINTKEEYEDHFGISVNEIEKG